MSDPRERARQAVDACVHCGLCLPSCPTYQLTGWEGDSPRGRIYQMKRALDGAVPLTHPLLRHHLDLCLDCRACETACPSGVPYHHALEYMRVQLRSPRARTEWLPRLLRRTLSSPRRLRVTGLALRTLARTGMLSLARRLGERGHLGEVGRRLSLLPPVWQGGVRRLRPLSGIPPVSAPRERVGLLEGCVMGELFGETNRRTAALVARTGAEPVVPAGQGCCGALHMHAGDREEALRLARHTVAVFEDSGVDVVVTNAAGCGAFMKEYGLLLADDPVFAERARRLAAKVRDISEYLVLHLPPPPRPYPARVAYQDACHLRHAQGIVQPPRELLRRIPGVQVHEPAHPDTCCGSAGTYNLLHREMSDALLERKVQDLAATEAEVVVTGNPGCLLQVARGMAARSPSIRVMHLVDFLAEAYGVGSPSRRP